MSASSPRQKIPMSSGASLHVLEALTYSSLWPNLTWLGEPMPGSVAP